MRTRTQIFQMFENDCIKPGFEECLRRLEQTYQESKDAYGEYLAGQFQEFCRRERELSQESPWAYLSIELLRTRVRQKDYRYRVTAYGEQWYLGDGKTVGDLDVSVILKQYHELGVSLKEQAKRYVGKVSELETEEHTARLLPAFHEYVKELILYGTAGITDLAEFQEVKKAGQFQLRVGECLEPGYLVYMENQEKDRDHILQWLEKNEKEAYCFQDFRGMDFKDVDLSDHDFRNTDFRDAVLERTDLSLSLLTGARFQRGNLKSCRMTGSMLHGADFSGADLRGARMDHTLMYDGKDVSTDWRLAGFPEGKFSGADLRGASFRGCVYCGADFSGADLRGADFQEAELFRCRFTEEQKSQIRTEA